MQTRIKPKGLKISVGTQKKSIKNPKVDADKALDILHACGYVAVGVAGTLGFCHLMRKGYLSTDPKVTNEETQSRKDISE